MPVAPSSMPSVGRIALRRLLDTFVILLVIIFLTEFGLIMAERGRKHIPAPVVSVAGEALSQTAAYLTDHPTTYLWHRVEEPAFPLVLKTFGRSAGLLFVALAFATLIGIPLGISMARSKGKTSSTTMLLLSVLGTSTPSFLLAMLLWVADIQMLRRLNVKPLPPTGFGWDAHLIMPMLVLAARPLAQTAQVTYVTLSDILAQDYLRTANAKGLSARQVLLQHAIPNIRNPVLTTLATSLRFALATLVVVEYFFLWPGAGLTLLQAINLGISPLVVDLIVCLGLFFLLVNLFLEIVSPLLDPRLKGAGLAPTGIGSRPPEEQHHGLWRDRAAWLGNSLTGWWRAARARRFSPIRRRSPLPPLPAGPPSLRGTAGDEAICPVPPSPPPRSTCRRVIHSAVRNPLVLLSTVMIIGFILLGIFGDKMTHVSPYQIHGVMMMSDGEIGAPPYAPSSTFPWGTDHIGRDIQSMVLAGAKQTLGLALLATVVRLLLGTILGLLAGWWLGSTFDRFVTGGIGVWAAFPVTLFAMILIQGMGIQQGTWVFIVALCVVGWAEIAQFVRRQVIGIKPELYVEAARSVGVPSSRILTQHVTPQLLAALLVLGILEMGAVLMLLAELGFLNIFLGGGYRVMIAETGQMQPVIAYFSDVPEWGALLANIRDWWRSYPWMAWYPGLAFFLAILALNLWGEGLRRFLADSRLNVSRLFSRYTALVGAIAVVGLVWLLRSSTPVGVYQAQAAEGFDVGRALQDVRTLASPDFQGRETGTAGAQAAAEYIASRMEESGLFPAGDKDTYIQAATSPRIHLVGMPRLEILDAQGVVREAFAYRKDFVEQIGSYRDLGHGVVVGLATGPDPTAERGGDPYRLGNLDLGDVVLLIPEISDKRIYTAKAAGVLVVNDDPLIYQRKYLFGSQGLMGSSGSPVMFVTSEAADQLLATAGSSLAELKRMQDGLEPGKAAYTAEGDAVRMAIPIRESDDLNEKYYNVVGYIPGTGSSMLGQSGGAGLDSQVIMVTAYYDGLGTGPDGTLYPGANDDASGVATMLELARALHESPYAPKKTIVFVAWTGGERYEGLSVKNVMNAKVGFNTLTVEAVLELSGVGAGDRREIALAEGSSYRLVRLFQRAASRFGVPATTRGRGPHYGMPSSAGFGGRDALTLEISWNGSDRTAHLAQDTFASLDPAKLRRLGQVTLLTLSVLSREVVY